MKSEEIDDYRKAVLEQMRQVHERHDLGHKLGAWPYACALCEAARAVEESGRQALALRTR